MNVVKKIILGIMTVTLCLSLVGCGAEKQMDENSGTDKISQTDEQSENEETQDFEKDLKENTGTLEESEIPEKNENIDVNAEIKVNPELVQYANITYADFKNKTGAEAEHYSGGVFAAGIPDTDVSVYFATSEPLGDEGFVLGENDQCYRLEGTLGALLDGLATEMTSAEFMEKLAVDGSMPDYSIKYGGETHYYISGTPYLSIAFDSDRNGIKDSVVYISVYKKSEISSDSWAWLFLDVDCSNVNKEIWETPAWEDEMAGSEGTPNENKHGELFDYSDFLDKYESWLYCDDYKNQDYDADGISDRIYRYVSIFDENTCFYIIYFGNGNVLHLDAEFDSYESFSVQMADLTEREKDELVVFWGNPGGTGFREYGSLAVFGWNGSCFEELKLPFESGENYLRTLEVHYERESNGNQVKVTIPAVGFEESIHIDDFWWDTEYYADEFTNATEDECVWQVFTTEKDNKEMLVCKINLFSYKHPGGIEICLEYKNGEFVPGEVVYLEENDIPGGGVI